MNTKFFTAAAVAALLSLTACASNPTGAQIGAGTLGTVGGAAVGGVIGHELGENHDQKKGR